MDDVDLTYAILTRLHALGVRVAIDDFGTGHSSLGYLARFPIDVVKIDQSFVRDIDRDPVKSAIVSAVVALSEAIGSTTVVEGVETLAQLEELKSLGCDVGPGLLLRAPGSRPAAFGKLLTADATHPPPDLSIVRSARRVAPGRRRARDPRPAASRPQPTAVASRSAGAVPQRLAGGAARPRASRRRCRCRSARRPGRRGPC